MRIRKAAIFALAATFVVFLAPARVNAESPEILGEGKTYLVQSNGATMAVLPANRNRTISVVCSGDANYNKETGVATFTKSVKLVASVPDQADVTITGENLALLPQK